MPTMPSSPPASRRSCSTSRGRLRRRARRRARHARHRPAAAGRNGRARRRDRAVGRLGLRARCAGRRAGLAARAGPRLCDRQRARADRAGRDPVRPDQRRRQGLGPLSALSRSRLRGGRECRRSTSRSALRAPGYGANDGQPQGRARLGLGANARRRDRRRDRRGQRGRQRRPSATARISGPRRSSRTASSAGAACPSPFPPTRSAIRLKGGVRENTTIALVATDATLTKAQAKRLAIVAHDGLARAIYPVHTPLDGDIVFAAATVQARRSPILSGVRRAWRARRQCAGAGGRARGVRGDRPALPGRAARLEGQIRLIIS